MTWAYDCSLGGRAVVGAVFAVSAFSKLRSRAAWEAYASWLAGIPLRPLQALGRHRSARLLAAAEAAVVLLVIGPATSPAGLAAGAALSLALTAGLAVAVRAGAREPCYCFGPSADPLGWLDVARNAVLAGLATAGAVLALAVGGHGGGAAESALAVISGLAVALLIIFFRDLAALVSPDGFTVRTPALGPSARLGQR